MTKNDCAMCSGADVWATQERLDFQKASPTLANMPFGLHQTASNSRKCVTEEADYCGAG